MVIDDFDFGRLSFVPDKTYSELVVDSDAVLADSVMFQGFEFVSGQGAQVSQASRLIKNQEFSIPNVFYVPEARHPLAIEELCGIGAFETPDHTFAC